MPSVSPADESAPPAAPDATEAGECAKYCPAFHHTIETVGRRWTGVVILELMRGELGFTAIKEAIPGISDRLLSDRLKELETEGMVQRTRRGREVGYALTDKGHGLVPVLDAVFAFNEQWVEWQGCEGNPPPG